MPLAWRPLVARRAVAGIEPVQFALAGTTPTSITTCRWLWSARCTALGTAPEPTCADHQKVYQLLLNAAEQSIRQSFESAAELAVDRHLDAVANLIATWTINSARDLA